MGTLSVFKGIDNSFCHENLFQFVSTLGLDFGSELFLSFDDLSIFSVSHQFKMELAFGGTDFDLDFGDSDEFLGLLVSH
jgi:hypothetical protein